MTDLAVFELSTTVTVLSWLTHARRLPEAEKETEWTQPPPPAKHRVETNKITRSVVSVQPQTTPRTKFVSYEVELYRSPALTRCPSCQTRVTSQVNYKVGTHAWLMCLVFVLLVFGCCLIPFFVDHFKDAYHSCPLCHRVLHVHRRRCCERE
uniref:LITAF domain-containing protein n=1 Tax=Cynoglossus semilaevis TaxID=244447 RepID=A0A3P8URZ5_CYNSE